MSHSNIFSFDSPNSYSVTIPKGNYLIEVWGASGGGTNGGKGAYIVAKLLLREEKNFFCMLVEKEKMPHSKGVFSMDGGFNGGGNGGKAISADYNSGSSGGGATDIRLSESLDDRIIVAAGGGGSSGAGVKIPQYPGGYGGNEIGGIGGCNSFVLQYMKVANQTYGYDKGNGEPGFNAKNYLNASCEGSGGGGGGYFGGFTLHWEGHNSRTGGGGGSSFVDPVYFYSYKMYSGNEHFHSPSGNIEQGHNGNRFIRITFLDMKTCVCKRISSYASIFLFVFINHK